MHSNPIPIQLFDAASNTFTYIVHDEVTREAIIIDPVDAQLDRDIAVLMQHGLRLTYILETHAHADHVTSSAALTQHTGARAAVPLDCGFTADVQQLSDGDVLAFGGEQIKALQTPGHTAGSMCFVWRNQVFTGDTLLIGGCGRTDFQSGSAKALYRSITEVLFALPSATTVWPGHDYHGKTHTTIGQEKQSNPRLVNTQGERFTEAQFVSLMNALNLPKPKRINEAVPANLMLGAVHQA